MTIITFSYQQIFHIFTIQNPGEIVPVELDLYSRYLKRLLSLKNQLLCIF